MVCGRGEISPISGAPAAASRVHGWSSSAPTGAHVSPSHATPARGSQVMPSAYVRCPKARTSSPAGPGLKRVGVLEREVEKAVAGAHLVSDGSPSPSHCTETPGAAEDVEDLLLGALEVKRRRPHPRIDLDSLEAYRPRVRGP